MTKRFKPIGVDMTKKFLELPNRMTNVDLVEIKN